MLAMPRGGLPRSLLRLPRRPLLTQRQALVVVAAACIAFAAGLLGAHLVYVLGSIFAAGLIWLIIRRPGAALVLAFALIPFQNLAINVLTSRYGIPLRPFTYWKDLLVGGLLIHAVWSRRREEGWGWARDPLVLGISFYAGLLLFDAAISPDLVAAGVALDELLLGLGLLMVVLLQRPSRQVLIACVIAVTCVGVIMAGLALWEQTSQGALPRWMGVDPNKVGSYSDGAGGYRSGSLFGEPPAYSFFMLGAVPLMIAAAVVARGRVRVLLSILAMAGVAGLIVAFTRSSLLGLLFALPLTLTLGVRPRRVGVLLALFAAGVAASATLSAYAAGDTRLVHTQADDTIHLNALERDLDFMVSNPLGAGLGQLDYVALRYKSSNSISIGPTTESAFLARGDEGGIAVLGAYLVLIFFLAMKVRRARLICRDRGDPFGVAVGAAALGSLVGYCVASLTLPIQPNTTMYGTIGLALAAALVPAARAARDDEIAGGVTPTVLSAAGAGVEAHRRIAL